MIRKLEKWVWVGGALLAANGGLINAVGLASLARQTVSHVTGATTLFSLGLAHGDLRTLAHIGLVLASFAAGAVLGGFIVENSALQLGRRYAAALATECALLAGAALLCPRWPYLGLDFAGAACGLQNAIAGTYSGAVLRTTHMTGIVTDLGASFGYLLRGVEVDWLRVRLHAILLGSFMAGAVIGGIMFAAFGFRTLYVSVLLTAALAAAYSACITSRTAAQGS